MQHDQINKENIFRFEVKFNGTKKGTYTVIFDSFFYIGPEIDFLGIDVPLDKLSSLYSVTNGITYAANRVYLEDKHFQLLVQLYEDLNGELYSLKKKNENT